MYHIYQTNILCMFTTTQELKLLKFLLVFFFWNMTCISHATIW